MLEVRRVESEVLQGVRYKVLWPHLENSQQAVIDIDHSTGAIHLAAFYKGEVVGVASLFNQKCKRMPELLMRHLAMRHLAAQYSNESLFSLLFLQS
jgi:hypothetical protein